MKKGCWAAWLCGATKSKNPLNLNGERGRLMRIQMNSCDRCVQWAGIFIAVVGSATCLGQPASVPSDNGLTLALPDHRGQLRWTASGFKVVQNSAKPGGREIGIRGQDASHRIDYLSFLFLFPEQAPMTSAKCRDGVIDPEKKQNPTLKVLDQSERAASGSPSITTVSYSVVGRDQKIHYSLRSFVATGDLCGDLEISSSEPIKADDPEVKELLASYQLDPNHDPNFGDVFEYAQVLFNTEMYKAAAPLFERALSMIPLNGAPFPSAKIALRVATDQAGMSYGISGNYAKARTIFDKGLAGDPDYPMYYYNLACADAGENKLKEAQAHLEQAFARKADVMTGEPMPDPTKDDSFLPYASNKSFWAALQRLQASK
jgi:hypothetical protein